MTGMSIEKFNSGLTKVFTVCPATPVLAAPSPKLPSGSAPDVKMSVKIGLVIANATK